MIFTTDLQNILNQLQRVSSLIPSNSSIPISECIKLELNGNELTITGTNIITTSVAKITVEGKQNGKAIVSGKKLYKFISSLPNNDVTFKLDNGIFKIVCGSIKFEISTFTEEDEYPEMPNTDNYKYFRIKESVLKKKIETVINFVAVDQMKEVLTGVLFNIEDNKLTMAATDSMRLCELVVEDIATEKESIKMTVPSEVLKIILNYLSNQDKSVGVFFNENIIVFEMVNTRIASRLISTNYPQYKAIIPASFNSEVIVNKNELKNAISRISKVSDSAVKVIHLKINKSELKVYCESVNSSSNAEEIIKINSELETTLGVPVSILTILTKIETENVLIKITNNKKPVVIMPETGSGLIFVQMLISVSE